MKVNTKKSAVRGTLGLVLAAGLMVAGTGAAFAASPDGSSAVAHVGGASSANPANDDEYTQMTDNVINDTNMPLTLLSASHGSGSGTHWQKQAQQTLAPMSS